MTGTLRSAAALPVGRGSHDKNKRQLQKTEMDEPKQPKTTTEAVSLQLIALKWLYNSLWVAFN